jgi:SAM-dependent methyltransferase
MKDNTIAEQHQKTKTDKKAQKTGGAGYYDFCRFDIIALITQKETEPISVLEIGCSGGGTLAKIAEVWQGAEVKGIEIVPEIAEYAQAKGLDVICRDIENAELPYEKEHFDYLIMADVLEHLREPEDTLLNMLKYLKKGGSFLCSIPNIQHASIINDLMQGKFEYTDAGILDRTHIRFFTLHSIRQLLSNVNLTTEHLQGVTWTSDGILLTDVMGEGTDSKKLFEFQQYLASAKKS